MTRAVRGRARVPGLVRRHLAGDDGGHDAPRARRRRWRGWSGAGGRRRRPPPSASSPATARYGCSPGWPATPACRRSAPCTSARWTGRSAGRYVAAGAVIGAGLYQFTPVKRRWLARCTAPDRHLPRPGVFGALRAGAGHGVCCVACCGTLMVALYALGIMSITWMVVLTVLIAGERLLARHRRGPRGRRRARRARRRSGGGGGRGRSMTLPPTGHPTMGMGTGKGMGAGTGTDEFPGGGQVIADTSTFHRRRPAPNPRFRRSRRRPKRGQRGLEPSGRRSSAALSGGAS